MKSEILEVAKNLSEKLCLDIIYWDKTEESEFQGITDDRINYGYITLSDTGKEFSFSDASQEYGCNSLNNETKYKLVVDLSCTSSENALHLILTCMTEECLIVRSASINSESIYKVETGEDIQQCGKKLVCVDFTHETILGTCLTRDIKEC